MSSLGWFKAGDNTRINGASLQRLDTCNAYESAYGAQIAVKGKHTWKLKIDTQAPNMVIGISSTTDQCNTHFYRNKDPNHYGYYNDGRKMSQQVNYASNPSDSNKVRYGDGDVITVHLDMDAGSVGFSKNGLFLGNAFNNVVKMQTYRVAIMLSKGNAKVEMISYETNQAQEEAKQSEVMQVDTEEAGIVKQWLRQTVKLPQYTGIFMQNGFDDMIVIREMTMQDLKEMDPQNKIKLGHKKKIMIFVKQLAQ